jgi:hypothetical protein
MGGAHRPRQRLRYRKPHHISLADGSNRDDKSTGHGATGNGQKIGRCSDLR